MTFFAQIRTERLVIRPLKADDYDTWYQGFSRRRSAQSLHDEGYLDMTACNKDWFNQLVATHTELASRDQQYIFAILTKSGRHVGMIDVVILARANMNWCELGYFVHNHSWRRGYAYEALSALLNQLPTFLEVHRIEAHVSLDNTPSRNLLEKLEFQQEVVREQFMFEGDRWVDKMVYTKLLHHRSLK